MRHILRNILAAVAILASTMFAGAEPLALSIITAEVGRDMVTEEPVLNITLDLASKEAFAEFTRKHVREEVVLRVDGREVMKARLQEPILGGFIQVNGGFTEPELRDIASLLSSGAAKIEVAPATY